MPSLKGTETEQNLKNAFVGEIQAIRRYLYFAQKAEVEGLNDVAAVFRSTAEGETGHAHGHLEYLQEVDDPATGKPIGPTGDNLKAGSAAGKASTRAPTGSRRSPRPGSRMPAASKMRSKRIGTRSEGNMDAKTD